MLKADVLAHFKTPSAAAKAIDVTPAAVSGWDKVVPEGSAYKFQVVTRGKLKVDPSLYKGRPKRGQTLATA